MPRRWSKKEEEKFRKELIKLYQKQNKTIFEISRELSIAPQTVFQRLKRLNIPSTPQVKPFHRNRRRKIIIPIRYSDDLAEFIGVMLGDGSLSHFQVVVTLGNKELSYAVYICNLIETVFKTRPKIAIRKTGYRDVYLGSVELTSWLRDRGLVNNKVKYQVGVPKWIYKQKSFMRHFIRGVFDTDGSFYKLKFGSQISFTNYSTPLLASLHSMLRRLQYSPSQISAHKVYLTKREDIHRFFKEITPKNDKHIQRFNHIQRVGTQAVNEGKL